MRVIPFLKMDGLGNDFVIIDERQKSFGLSDKDIIKMADRKTGVGFDQLIVIANPINPAEHTAAMKIYNADGSTAGACGNGTRCVGKVLLAETGKASLKIEAPGNRVLEVFAGKQITANMGKPNLDWHGIPLAEEVDTLGLPKIAEGLPRPSAVNVGNPHVIFFVMDLVKVDVEKYGPIVENHHLFPERTNVEFVEVKAQDHLRMKVWERGAGMTKACGTGACASLVAAVRRGLCRRSAKVEMDGGELQITWSENGDILMTGDAHQSFAGSFFPDE